MSRSVIGCCVDCGKRRVVPRVEIDRAARPKCLKCGGALNLSAAAQADMAKVASAQAGELPKGRRPTHEAPQRIIPVVETARYVFHEFPFIYGNLCKRPGLEHLKDLGPREFYHRFDGRGQARDVSTEWEFIHEVEREVFDCGRPYYKVWPSIASALCHTEMRVTGEYLRLPYLAFEVRFPDHPDNPMAPIRSMLVARMAGHNWTDGREWSFAICAVDGAVDDPKCLTWVCDLPVRQNVLIEDALQDTAIAKDCPDPGMARRMLRVAVGVCFFAIDRHELILPEVRRRVIEQYRTSRRQPTPEDVEKALTDAREHGLSGFKVGSELTLPRPIVNRVEAPGGLGDRRELTEGHIRRGHLALIPCGEGRQQRKLVFRHPTVVRPDLPLAPAIGHKVRLT